MSETKTPQVTDNATCASCGRLLRCLDDGKLHFCRQRACRAAYQRHLYATSPAHREKAKRFSKQQAESGYHRRRYQTNPEYREKARQRALTRYYRIRGGDGKATLPLELEKAG